ncbi:MAG: FliA/WhiG family RNA polymerase sigma factor [Gemmatimonadetes bacterium]|nr:FliA/WhiG family RNA polymerase sigma factor [Gemmatimonadota bacterium]
MGTALRTADDQHVESATPRNVGTQPHRPLEHAALWVRYAEGDESARNELLERHLGLVHYVAAQLARSLSDDVNVDDLIGSGTLGLIGALEHFDPSRGLQFSTFAAPRIRGAILDDLRSQDRVPRSVRRKAREVNAAHDRLASTLGRVPTPNETAGALGIDLDTWFRWQGDLEGTHQLSLDQHVNREEDDACTILDRIVPITEDGIEDRLTSEAEVALMRDAIAQLGHRERQVLTLYYYESLTMAEIAKTIGITDSRVSQIRVEALARLRAKLAPMRRFVA